MGNPHVNKLLLTSVTLSDVDTIQGKHIAVNGDRWGVYGFRVRVVYVHPEAAARGHLSVDARHNTLM
jgi:hypothetical protein